MSVQRSIICIIYAAVYFAVAPANADEFDMGAAAYKEARYETAARIFEKLAEKGDYRAMSIFGAMYARGQGISQNPEKAFMWFKEAAKFGRPDAEHRLGMMYDYGYGVRKNHRKAIRWYQKAVDHGYFPSRAMMGLKYARGEGFKQDKVKAYAWLLTATDYFTNDEVELGDLENAFPLADRRTVRKVFASLEEDLTTEEKESAAGLAREIAAKSGTTLAISPNGKSQKSGESNAEGAKCIHGCLNWGEDCNVDPRGARKCRRRCEKFGEICE